MSLAAAVRRKVAGTLQPSPAPGVGPALSIREEESQKPA